MILWIAGLLALTAGALVATRTYILRASVSKEQLENTELLRDKYVLITGGTAGIGLATAKAMYKMGANIILTARDPTKTEQAIKEIKAFRPKDGKISPKIESMPLNLADLNSVQQFVNEFRQRNLPIDFLILNAGAVFLKPGKTRDGFEQCWQINHLSHFLLTTSLLDIINKCKSKVIIVASDAHKFIKKYTPLTMEQVRSDLSDSPYSGYMGPYSLSKLCNILFAEELVKRVDKGVTVVSVHPGFVQTEISREAPGYLTWLIRLAETALAKTPMQGAYTTLYVALNNVENGGYYADCKLTQQSQDAKNPEYAKKLWELSEECLKK
jgi:NAD(P)-dependent dehydrogenase (short-subunit alcohol dehydrogenase family)